MGLTQVTGLRSPAVLPGWPLLELPDAKLILHLKPRVDLF